MRIIVLAIAICLFPGNSFSQGMYGFEAGVGATSVSTIGNGAHERFAAKEAPTFCITYSRKLESHLYGGAKLLFEQYAFEYTYSMRYTAYNINHKSNYVSIAPWIGLGLGKRRVFHMQLFVAPGFLVSGSQHSIVEWYNGPYYSTKTRDEFSSSREISRFICRFGLGFEQRIRITSMYRIVLSEGYSFMVPDLTRVGYKDHYYKSLDPGHVYFRLGIMRKIRRQQSQPNPQNSEK